MYINYPALFFKENGSYSVVFPDLNDLATFGNSYDNAMAMAVDLLAGEFHWAKLHSEAVPEPSKIEDIKPDDGSFPVLVSFDVDDYIKKNFEKPVKKTLSIPKWLDDTCKAKRIKFSKVLQEALKHEIGLSN